MMPMALWRPVKSNFAGRKAIVASPGTPPGVKGGIKNLMIDSGFRSEYAGRATTHDGLKCFMALIFLAAAGSARMVVSFESGSS